MTTTEHLQLIKAKCQELLAKAEKRTPGRWKANDNEVVQLFRGHLQNQLLVVEEECDATFISSCAGNAEAGWRSTIAAIDGLEEMDDQSHLYQFMESNILAAWPIELLQ
jgi:hypothetical protein